MERLGEAVGDFGVLFYMFCLMSNHFHLVVETPQVNLSRFMQQLFTAYTMYFNLRYERHGHVLTPSVRPKSRKVRSCIFSRKDRFLGI
jgi:REP element-mobilizing transposase RayT